MFFIFTGNISNIPAVSDTLSRIVGGREFISGVAVSQVISNVPAALLLYPFSASVKDLMIGVNAGGLGTLVASLASLISFKLFSAVETSKRKSSGVYLLFFTLCNVVMLFVLALLYFITGAVK